MGRYASEYDSATGIRKILKAIFVQLQRDEISIQKARGLSSIAYMMLGTIQENRKEMEIDAMDKLKAELEKLGG
jgi:hypothetical protein